MDPSEKNLTFSFLVRKGSVWGGILGHTPGLLSSETPELTALLPAEPAPPPDVRDAFWAVLEVCILKVSGFIARLRDQIG